MATTIKALVTKSMQKAGILTKNQQPSADEMTDAVDAFNAMLSSWSNDSMLVYARAWETFSGIGGQQDYTWGPMGDFTSARPIKIISCTVTIGQTDEVVTVVNDKIYAEQIAFKNIPGVPQLVNYDNAYPLGKLRFWPFPNTNYPLNFQTEKELSQYGINDAVNLPPGWERALIFNGAIEICSDYGQEAPDTVVSIASKSLGLIRKAVNVNRDLDAGPLQKDAGNVYSGWWYR